VTELLELGHRALGFALVAELLGPGVRLVRVVRTPPEHHQPHDHREPRKPSHHGTCARSLYLFLTANKRLSKPAAFAVLTILLTSRASVDSSACRIARPSGQILPGAGRRFAFASSHALIRSLGWRPMATSSRIFLAAASSRSNSASILNVGESSRSALSTVAT